VLAFAPSAASAHEIHFFGSSFGSLGSGEGQFNEPAGVAVNDSTELGDEQAGYVYVVDKGNNRVEYFDSAGEYKGQLDGAAAPTGVFSDPEWIAVDDSTNPLDPSKGDVYVTDNGHKAVDKFSATGTYLGQVTGTCEKEAETPPSCSGFTPFTDLLYGVAVDLTGELWVYQGSAEYKRGQDNPDSSGAIYNYDDALANAFLASRTVTKKERAVRPGFAVGPEDDLYVNFGERHGEASIFVRFTNTGEFISTPGSTNNQLAQDEPAAAVDLANNDLYIDNTLHFGNSLGQTAHYVNVFDASDEMPIETFSSERLGGGAGIAVSSATKAVYVADLTNDRVDVFDYGDIPEVTTEPASNVEVLHETVGATLHGEVIPNESPLMSCEFEYGTSTSYGHSEPCEQSLEAISKGKDGKGDEAAPVSANISDLLPDTTYHFRLRATNENDEGQLLNPGSDQTFSTPGPSIVAEAPASEVTATTATLSGEVDPGGVPLSKCEFEYGTSEDFEANGLYEHSAPCEPDAAEVGSGTVPVVVHARLKGLLGGTIYRFRLHVSTEVLTTHETATVAGPGREFPTLPVPVIANGEATNLANGSAELRATVNPKGLQVTHCAFEYGTTPAYGSSVRCAQTKSELGAGTAPVPVSAQLSELGSNTTYYWRLSVRDEPVKGELREAFEPGHTFVYSTAGAELPDRRAYEMVSPVRKNGGLIGDIFVGLPPQISANGSRVIAPDIQCFAPAESCTAVRQTTGDPIEMQRTPGGWVTSALAPPAARFSENSAWEVSADENTALFSMPTGPAGEDEWYVRSPEGSFAALGPATGPGRTGVGDYGTSYRQATADFSHLVWNGRGGTWPFDGTTAPAASLYEYVGTGNKEPFLVGVTGETAKHDLIGTCGTTLGGASSGSSLNPLSADGRTVYFTVRAGIGGAGGCPGGTGTNLGKEVPVSELYARVDGEGPQAHTVAISEPQALATSERAECQSDECRQNTSEHSDWRNAEFAGASADGSAAFFTSEQQLTDNATQGSENLYESLCTQGCETDEEARRLIDVSESSGGAKVSGGPGVQGVMAISADGSHVYFVANGLLASGARPGDCSPASEAGRCNLYVYERDARYPEGHTAFIASLPGSDRNATGGLPTAWAEGPALANVTPDGRFLVFGSHGDLTPDTHAGGSTQIFRYDAEGEQLTRVSIGEGGFDDDGNAGTGEATIVGAEVDEFETAGPARSDPTMSNDGAYVFFQSPRALTPHALNDVRVGTASTATGRVPVYAQNVYEWHEGHVYLISDGHDASTAATTPHCVNRVDTPAEKFASAVCLLGTDATGDNVFFMTADQLAAKDTDTQVDIYDARICESASGNPCISEPAPPAPPCGGEACHGIPAATPSLLAPGTASFNGEGNTTPPAPAVVKKKATTCKRGYVKKKVKKRELCIKTKAKKKARKASNKGRA
jgi:DNA-binding beta-propeller fold protein YncE